MMFLQFFIWGAWYTSIAVYMTNHGMTTLTHWPYTVNPVAAIAAPFFLGLVADRYFATEKVLGVLHVLGGLILFAVPGFTGSPTTFILLLLLYNLCYMPTLGLANSLAFHHIQSQEQQFPLIRVFGTVGWIVAGLFISLFLGKVTGVVPEQTAMPLYTAATASVLLGVFSFTLPHTPPPGRGQPVSLRSIAGLDAFAHRGDSDARADVRDHLYAADADAVPAARREENADYGDGRVGAALCTLCDRGPQRRLLAHRAGHPASRSMLRLLFRDRPDLRR